MFIAFLKHGYIINVEVKGRGAHLPFVSNDIIAKISDIVDNKDLTEDEKKALQNQYDNLTEKLELTFQKVLYMFTDQANAVIVTVNSRKWHLLHDGKIIICL